MTRPANALVIICDDLAWGDLGCHGNPVARTPRLDRLHAESARCTRWCSGPLCSPARASLLTGRWHLRTRVLDTYCGRSLVDPDEPTLGRLFTAAGHATGCFGKWHLGDGHPLRPEDLGFAETLWHRAGGLGQPGDFWANHRRWTRDSYFDPLLVQAGRPVPSQGYCSDIFTDAALGFIERSQREQRPFLCYLAFNAPHSPLLVADPWADPYRALGVNETHARLYGMNANLDGNVGRLLDALDRLGLAEDTVLLFTSDHGPCPSARDLSAPAGRQDRWNAGLRGIKGDLYEGGIRVPALWRLPGRFPAGTTLAEPTHPVDVLPTLCGLCGVAGDAARPSDGIDLTPRLAGGGQAAERALFMQWHRGDVPILGRNAAVIESRLTWLRPAENRPAELYDLATDPGQSHDLAAELPAEVRRLGERYERWFDEVGASLGAGTFDPPDLSVGHPAQPTTLLTTQDWRMLGPEGWCRDDLRGEWRLRVHTRGPYRVRVRFRADAPAGQVRLRLDHLTHDLPGAGADGWHEATLSLDPGSRRLEAWLESACPVAGLRLRRFLPALYVELTPL